MSTPTVDYPALVTRCRSMIERNLDGRHHVAVVSRGDAGLASGDGLTASHFPAEENGRWVGYHPADSTHALALLDAARHRGVTHLLLPATSSWWLDHYPDFADWLTTNARLVEHLPDTGWLYELPAVVDGTDERNDSAAVPGDHDDTQRWVRERFDDQVRHLLAVVAATRRPAAGGDDDVVLVTADGDTTELVSGTTYLVVPAALERLAPEVSRRAHLRGARHRLLVHRRDLGAVYVLSGPPTDSSRRPRR